MFLLGVLSFFLVKPLLLAIFLGGILSYLLLPIYKWLVKKLKNKTIAALLVCFATIIILVVPGVFFMKALVEESYFLFVLVKQKLAIGFFRNCENQFCQMLTELGNNNLFAGQIEESIKVFTTWIVDKVSEILIGLPSVLLNLFVVFFSMFYFLREGNDFVKKVNDFLSMKEHRYDFIMKRLTQISHGIVYGYFLVAVIQGIVGGIGFYFFGISSPVFWGIVMAFLALIPYLGTGLVWGPAALFMFLEGMFQNSNLLIFKGIGLLLYGLLIVSLLDNFLKPKLMGSKAKVHPAIMMVGILGGVFMFGPLGVILGPLILSLTYVLLDIYFIKK